MEDITNKQEREKSKQEKINLLATSIGSNLASYNSKWLVWVILNENGLISSAENPIFYEAAKGLDVKRIFSVTGF